MLIEGNVNPHSGTGELDGIGNDSEGFRKRQCDQSEIGSPEAKSETEKTHKSPHKRPHQDPGNESNPWINTKVHLQDRRGVCPGTKKKHAAE